MKTQMQVCTYKLFHPRDINKYRSSQNRHKPWLHVRTVGTTIVSLFWLTSTGTVLLVHTVHMYIIHTCLLC